MLRPTGRVESAIPAYLNAWEATYEDLRQGVADAKALGLPPKEILPALDYVPNAVVHYALAGRPMPPPPLIKGLDPKVQRALLVAYRQRYAGHKP